MGVGQLDPLRCKEFESIGRVGREGGDWELALRMYGGLVLKPLALVLTGQGSLEGSWEVMLRTKGIQCAGPARGDVCSFLPRASQGDGRECACVICDLKLYLCAWIASECRSSKRIAVDVGIVNTVTIVPSTSLSSSTVM